MTAPEVPASVREAMLVEAARDIVALWQNPKIKALPRVERNTAIEDARTRLINTVEDLEGPPYSPDLVEAVARAIIDCWPREEYHANYGSWTEEAKRTDQQGEFAREWLDARRTEARAAIIAVQTMQVNLPAPDRLALCAVLLPDGWVAVKREPTFDMLQTGAVAAIRADKSQIYWEAIVDCSYRAMIAASPTTDTPEKASRD